MTRIKDISGYIMLAIAILLVAALVTGTVLVCRTPEVEYAGKLTAGDFSIDTVRYSPETEGAFKQNVGKLLTKFLQSVCAQIEGFEQEKPVIQSSSYVSEPLLTLFRNAAIPTDKLLAFGELLADLDTDKTVTDILSYILVVDVETHTARFASPQELAARFGENVDLTYALTSFVLHTSLTADEVARLAYEGLKMLSEGTAKDALETLGRDNFVTLVVSLTTVYDTYLSFNLKGGTKNEARLLGELLYETGVEVERLTDTIGAENIVAALRIGNNSALSPEKLKAFLVENGYDASEIVSFEKLEAAADSAARLTESVLYFAESAFVSVGNETFEALSAYTESLNEGNPDDRYLNVYYSGISSAILKGVEHAVEKGSANDVSEIIDCVARLKLSTENFGAEPPSDQDARLAELRAEFTSLWNNIELIAKKYGDLGTVADYEGLSQEEKEEFNNAILYINSFDYGALTTGGSELLSVILVNVGFNAISGVIAGAIK